jgi:accessory colonization factor AcfC
MLDDKSRVELYVRPAGILVRKDNPKKIKSLDDLTRSGVRIVDVNGASRCRAQALQRHAAGLQHVCPGVSAQCFCRLGWIPAE